MTNTPITFVQPCPPHQWAHSPTVGSFDCWKCKERINYDDPRYAEMLKNGWGGGQAVGAQEPDALPADGVLTEGTGTTACPICDKGSPHWHDPRIGWALREWLARVRYKGRPSARPSEDYGVEAFYAGYETALYEAANQSSAPQEPDDDAAYHCAQARNYISLPAAGTPEKHMVSARWHLDKALARLQAKAPETDYSGIDDGI